MLSGDSLFVGSAGRPDLLGDEQTEELTRALYRTLHDFYLQLPDYVIVYPGHGAGSPCGADIGDRLESTVGFERRHNPFLLQKDFAAFKSYAEKTAPPVPSYYPRMKKENAEGPELLREQPMVRALPPEQFAKELARESARLVDTRNMLAFGGAHIPGALNIGDRPLLSIWAGWLLDPDQPLLLVLPDDAAIDQTVSLFLRTGYRRFAGYLAGGIEAWQQSGRPLHHLPQLSVHALHHRASGMQVLDVRTPEEWKSGHVLGAKHIFLPDLPRRRDELERRTPLAVYCGSGYRASIGASLLLKEGFEQVYNVPGSWTAWENANLPISEK